MSAERYVEIFWETVARYQAQSGKFEVYKAERDDYEASFRFGFDGFAFQLLYFQCGDLVRDFPNILDAEEEVVNMMGEHGRNAWHSLRRLPEQAGKVDYEVYNSKRAWAIARGVYTTNLALTSKRTYRIRELLELPGLGPPLETLLDIEAKSVHSNWGMAAYLQVFGLLYMICFFLISVDRVFLLG